MEDDIFFFLDIRLGQFYLLEVLLRLLVTHANMAAQRQESSVRMQKKGLTTASPGCATPFRTALDSDSDP